MRLFCYMIFACIIMAPSKGVCEQDVLFFFSKGEMCLEKREYKQAVNAFTEAIHVDPSFDKSYFNRGFARFHSGDYAMAVADYSKFLEINPYSTEALSYRGDARYYNGDYYWAAYDYSTAIKINPEFSVAYNQLAWLYAVCPDARYRNGGKAVELAQKAIDISHDETIMDTLAAAYAEKGDFGSAISTQKKVMDFFQKTGNIDTREYRERLEFFEAGKPWRDNLPIPSEDKGFIPKSMQVAVGTANVRQLPSITSPIVSKLYRGDIARLVYRENDWYIIKMKNGKTGWASATLFEPGKAVEEKITAEKTITEKSVEKTETEKVVMETKPHKITETMPEKNATEKNQGKASVSVDKADAVISVFLGCIRKGPSLESTIEFKLKMGRKVKIIDTAGDWYLIKLENGRKGWAHKSLFLKLF